MELSLLTHYTDSKFATDISMHCFRLLLCSLAVCVYCDAGFWCQFSNKWSLSTTKG